ncbi:MAG TPA: hypothetical protein VG942_06790 [Hyphomonadaceae bacterium]|nr:hypothetical protein [Hyphomonadaceae bacterium]
MREGHRNEEVRAVDADLGDDGDMPGIAQELTTDDIDDIALDPNLTVGERRERLTELRDELYARRAGDFMGDMEQIMEHLSGRLAALDNPLESDSELAAAGMDADDRSDDDDPADHVDDEDEDERIEDLSRRRI